MDTAKARKHLVDSQVRPNDVTDRRLIGAMGALPREAFMPSNKRHLAYVETDVPLFEGRWLLKARDFSKLVQVAKVDADDLVLDLGCGLGYSSAVLSHLCSVVVGMEKDEETAAKAAERVAAQGVDNFAAVSGALQEGCAKQGPYDVIILPGGGVRRIPEALLQQLKPEGGRLVAIHVENGVGHATVTTRHGDAFGDRVLFEAHPAGILPGFNLSEGFAF